MTKSSTKQSVGAAIALFCVLAAPSASAISCVDFNEATNWFGEFVRDPEAWDIYEPPQLGEIGNHHHGTLTRCEKIPGNAVRQTTDMDHADEAYAMRFVTQDSEGNKALASAVLFTSNADDWDNDGDYPVVVFNTATIGIHASCGPTVQTFSESSTLLVRDKVNRFLRDGYNVLVPDYFGHGIRGQQGHPYLEGKSNGRTVLNAIRAARSLPNGLMFKQSAPTVAVPLAMQGYSQGGHVTAWAAELAPTYTPEIQFNAIRAGGVPVNLHVTLDHAMDEYEAGGSDGGYVALLMSALNNATDSETQISLANQEAFIQDAEDVAYWRNLAASECRGTQQWMDILDGLDAGSFDTAGFRDTTAFKRWLIRNSLRGGLAEALLEPDANEYNYAAEQAAETQMSRPPWAFMIYGSFDDSVAPAAESYALVQSWPGPVIAESDRVLGYINVPSTDGVWVNTTGPHGLDETDMYWTIYSSYRYTPDEWLFDRMQ